MSEQADRARGASPTLGTADEPGATDNRLSLDPNDPAFDFTKEWTDGKSYTLTNVRVTQVSPGEFRVESAEAAPAEEEGEPGAEGEDSGAMGMAQEGGTGYKNPAIAKMMED